MSAADLNKTKGLASASDYRAGWSISDWCYAVNLSRAGFYTLDLKPASVKVGKRHIIREQPADYLARVAAQHAVGAKNTPSGAK